MNIGPRSFCTDLAALGPYCHDLGSIDPLHKWRINFNNNTDTSLASHSSENSFVLTHECEAEDVPSIVI